MRFLILIRPHELRRRPGPFAARCNKWARAIGLGALLLWPVTPVQAQSVRTLVLVRGRDTVPPVVTNISSARLAAEAPGFVVLVEPDGREIARVPIDSVGFNALLAPAPGRYRLGTERIGYRSTTSILFRIDVDEIMDVSLEFPDSRVELPDAELENIACVALTDVDAVEALWAETHKALAAAAWSDGQRAYRYVSHEYDRSLDLEGRVVSDRTKTTAGKPRFWDAGPAGGARRGYVSRSPDGSISYYAPTPEVLLNRSFSAGHCFSLVRDDTTHPGRIGLAFAPVQGSTGPAARGTLWIDEETLELRTFDYRITDLSPDDVSGSMELARISPARWVVRRWVLRVPHHRLRDGSPVLAGYRELGGEITSVTATDTPWGEENRTTLARFPTGEAPVIWPTVTEDLGVSLAYRISFGLKGGLSRSTVHGDGIATQRRSAFHAGGFIAFAPARIFALQIEGTFSRRGAQDPDGRLEIDYVDVPLLAVFRTPRLGLFQATPRISVGPTVSYRLRCRVSDRPRSTETDCRDDTETIGFGLTIGAGAHLRVGPQTVLLEASYLHGLTNANRAADGSFDFKNRSVSFSFGLSFPLVGGL